MTTTDPEYTARYNQLIDKQTRAFIEQTNQWYPPDTIDFSMAKQRHIYNAMCREFHNGYPDGISATDDTITTDDHKVPVRRYSHSHASDQSRSRNGSAARVIYFHGGGFVVGGLDSHDDICADICAVTGLDVTAVDYRLAPEHLHPCAFDDSRACVLYECTHFNVPVVLCGDSAGGNLVAAVSHALRDANPTLPIAGQVLIYPALGGDTATGSYVRHANAPMLSTRDVVFYSAIRTGGTGAANLVSLAPLLDDNFSNLPETVAFSAACDPLADDAQAYAAAIEAAGGKAIWYNEEGLVHGYLRARHTVDRARDSFRRITDSVARLAKNATDITT